MIRNGISICWALLIAGCGLESARRDPPDSPVVASGVALSSADSASDGAIVGNAAAVRRRIVFEAEVKLVVSDFSATESAIAQLVKEHGGYLANASVDRTSGERRFGSWKARIPVDRFETFVDVISQLGMPESHDQTAQDVTEEYVDLEARISNQKRLEERILKLLDNSDGNITDVIEVERELARVRGEIEQMEGRLRYLTNRTEMTTVTIYARELRDYASHGSPTFFGRVRQAWVNSLLSVQNVGAGLAVATVFLLPWIIVLGVVIALPALGLRLLRRWGNGGDSSHPS